jgi:hypothetical protein
MRIVMTIYEAARTGRTVALSQRRPGASRLRPRPRRTPFADPIGPPNADMASMTLPSANERVVILERGGKPAVTSKAVVSKDGKILTITQDGTDAKGQAVHNTP